MVLMGLMQEKIMTHGYVSKVDENKVNFFEYRNSLKRVIDSLK